jgi:hypothetical protein
MLQLILHVPRPSLYQGISCDVGGWMEIGLVTGYGAKVKLVSGDVGTLGSVLFVILDLN